MCVSVRYFFYFSSHLIYFLFIWNFILSNLLSWTRSPALFSFFIHIKKILWFSSPFQRIITWIPQKVLATKQRKKENAFCARKERLSLTLATTTTKNSNNERQWSGRRRSEGRLTKLLKQWHENGNKCRIILMIALKLWCIYWIHWAYYIRNVKWNNGQKMRWTKRPRARCQREIEYENGE